MLAVNALVCGALYFKFSEMHALELHPENQLMALHLAAWMEVNYPTEAMSAHVFLIYPDEGFCHLLPRKVNTQNIVSERVPFQAPDVEWSSVLPILNGPVLNIVPRPIPGRPGSPSLSYQQFTLLVHTN